MFQDFFRGWGNGYLPFLASENSRQSIVARQPSYLFETFRFSLLAWTHDNPWFTRAVVESKNPKMKKFIFGFLVEATGLEPTTSWSLTKRATKLRYASSQKKGLFFAYKWTFTLI